MIEPEFNLLEEPWIRIRRPDCSVDEVSLETLFAHAHEYEDLAGETPAQDLAMLRLLLAVLHCVFQEKMRREKTVLYLSMYSRVKLCEKKLSDDGGHCGNCNAFQMNRLMSI